MMATIKGVSSFSAEQKAQALRKAMKGFGTDEDAIIDILTKLNVFQRQQVLITYKSTTGRGAGTDEGCLIEIVASHTNEEIGRIDENYTL